MNTPDTQLSIFHNTLNQSGAELAESDKKANSLAILILKFFRQNPGCTFTPFEVQDKLDLGRKPITSIRRAMTDLTHTDPPYLVKTDIRKQGEYGADNYCWRLA
jgi:hypothetical protein